MKHSRHVMRSLRGGWSVSQSDASRASKTFDRQEDAISYGRDLARKERVDLFVHRTDGSVQEREKFSPETRPKPPA